MSEYYNPEVQQLYPDTCAIKSQQFQLPELLQKNTLMNNLISASTTI